MSELISRSMAKAEIMDWARVITNPKMLATEDTMHILDSMEAATDEEFKDEAKRRGYNLIKIPEKVKLLPCVRGNTEHRRVFIMSGLQYYSCRKCGLVAEDGKSERQAKLNWNKMIEEKMKDGKVN